jgi:hypothetical protein
MFANKSFGTSARNVAESRKIREVFPGLVKDDPPLAARNRGRRAIPPMPEDRAESPDPISWRELPAHSRSLNGQLAGWLLGLQNLAAELAELFGAGGAPCSRLLRFVKPLQQS